MSLEVRASDAEREAVVEQLRDHAAAGRLDTEELAERLGEAYSARSRGDLARVLRELPQPEPDLPLRGRGGVPPSPPSRTPGRAPPPAPPASTRAAGPARQIASPACRS